MNKIKVKIIGKNIDIFIKRLLSLNVDLYRIEHLKYNEVNITLNKNDYNKIKKLKTSYEIKIIKLYGINKIEYNFKKYKYLLYALLISFLFIIFLSNIIFKVEVIHSDKKVRELKAPEITSKMALIRKIRLKYVKTFSLTISPVVLAVL